MRVDQVAAAPTQILSRHSPRNPAEKSRRGRSDFSEAPYEASARPSRTGKGFGKLQQRGVADPSHERHSKLGELSGTPL